MVNSVDKKVRSLYQWEIEEFEPIFGETLNYVAVRIHEGSTFPDMIDRIGRRLKGMEAPKEGSHNAITLGNHCYFPVNLPDTLVPLGDKERYKLDWLVHEVTHAWQFQHTGWIYLFRALYAQFKEKEKAYDFGWKDGLIESRQMGKTFLSFNPEQQGNIVQSFYVRKQNSKDTEAWDPYIDDLKRVI